MIWVPPHCIHLCFFHSSSSLYSEQPWIDLNLEELEIEVEEVESLVLQMMDMDVVEPEVAELVEMEADSANDGEMVGMGL